MKYYIQLLISVFLILVFFRASDAQWQYCGNYTGNVLPFAEIDSVLIAGTYGSGVYYTDNGINWSYSTNGMTDNKILSLTVNGNYVFAGSENGGVYRSSDKGINWIPANNGLTSFEIHTICSNAGNVYAGTNTGVYMTQDNGTIWTKISSTAVGNIIYAVTAYNNKIIATSVNGVFITSNGGINWNNITTGISSYIYCLSNFNNTAYAGSSNNGVYKTTNDGLNWISINSGLPGGKAVRTVFCENEKIYAALYNGGGIYFLPSAGILWVPANEGLTQLTCYTVIAYKNHVYAGTTSGIFRRSKAEFTSIRKIEGNIPRNFILYQNYPNPFNSTSNLKFEIAKSGDVKIAVYDIMGREVQTLVNKRLESGTYEVSFDASRGGSVGLNSGVYFYTLETEDFMCSKKMLLIK
jgi:hypothetical protein